MKLYFSIILMVLATCSMVARAQTQDPASAPANFEGATYQGQLLRLTADGQRQDAIIDILVSEDGSLFGSMNIALPGHGNNLFFQGSLDNATGRGFIKTRFGATDGSGRLLPNPDAEKIPVFFFRDGKRVVGGSIDVQGTALTFRAFLVSTPPGSGPLIPTFP